MTNNRTVTCQHCKKELPRDHKGPCPYCGEVGKIITATAHGEGVGGGVATGVATAVRRQLDKDERELWDKLVIFFKDNIIVDGFEIGFPSGIKIIFRRRR